MRSTRTSKSTIRKSNPWCLKTTASSFRVLIRSDKWKTTFVWSMKSSKFSIIRWRRSPNSHSKLTKHSNSKGKKSKNSTLSTRIFKNSGIFVISLILSNKTLTSTNPSRKIKWVNLLHKGKNCSPNPLLPTKNASKRCRISKVSHWSNPYTKSH